MEGIDSITTNVVQFSKGLNLTSSQLGDVMKMIRENGYLMTADKISTSLQYEVQHLAGRMLVFYINKITPNTVAEYVQLNRGKSLRDPICDFMLENATKIEQAISIGHENDSLHAYFGANTLRKQYLLRLGYDVSTLSENIQYFYMRVAVELYHKRNIDEVVSVYMHLSRQLYTHATPTLLNAGSRTTQMRSSFVKDTEVITINDGVKKIQDVKIGDIVVSHTNKPRKVEQLHKNTLNGRKILKLSVSKTKDVYVTDNHRFWSSTNKKTAEWNRVDELKAGDYIAIPNYKGEDKKFVIDVMEHHDYIINNSKIARIIENKDEGTLHPETQFQHSNLLRGCNQHDTMTVNVSTKGSIIKRFWEITPDFANLIGMFLGDGHIMNSKGYVKGIGFTVHKANEDEIKYISSICENVFGVRISYHRMKSQNVIQVLINSAIVGLVFRNLFGKGFAGKFLPPMVYEWNTELVNNLLAGLITTDGCISKEGIISITMSNQVLTNQIYHLCRSHGIDISCKKKPTRPKLATCDSYNISVPKITEILKKTHKYYTDDRVKECISSSEQERGCNRTTPITIGDNKFLRISSIEETDRTDEFVYTIGVEKDHSYTVEGLLCENCFLITIDDNLHDILYTGVGDVGMISRYNGGIGIDISRLRHSEIGNDGQSKGISPVLHLYNAVTRYVDQGGKRNGAETVFLRTHHYDFPEFVKSIEKTGDKYDRNHDIHISGWTSWLFWERVASDKEWTMFCPNKTKDLNDLYGEEFNKRYVQYEVEAKQLKDAYSKCKSELKELEKDPLYIENPLYRQKNIELADLTKKQINYRTMPARELLKLMTEVQMHSEGPFIMNGDSANFKSNHRHRGYIRSSNLCQEIVEYTDKNEIASCNLASISLKMFCVKPVDHNFLLNANSSQIMAHLRECYDFNTLGNIVRWIVMNLNMVIDNNFYPLDEFDSKTGHITKRGKIATTNYKSRPLGIGVSGFSDMLARLDLPFCKDDKGREIHPAVELLNKMVFACIEFNGLIKSCELALTHGPYETFIHEGKKCPYAEGKFQHDLWADEYKVLEKLRSESGVKRNWVRKPEDDIPVSPSDWGQHRIVITGVRDSDHTVISTEIEPSWESLRKNIVFHGIYNSLITALMPTASTSQIIGNCESTEAHMSIVYAREVKSGFYIITNEYLCRDLQSIGLLKDDILNAIRSNWDGTLSGIVDYVSKNYKDFKDFDRLNHIRRKYMTAYELSNRIFMKMASDRGRYVDQSQSLNVFLPKVSTEALSALLYYGYDLGLKTVMYYLYQKKFSSIAKFGELANSVETKNQTEVKSIETQELKQNVELDSLALTPAEICRRDALTGKKICEMCT